MAPVDLRSITDVWWGSKLDREKARCEWMIRGLWRDRFEKAHQQGRCFIGEENTGGLALPDLSQAARDH